ncbi:MAG: SpoIIE family protein phosphatase [Leptospiraceae bacterium]|nr:SpoIIE family protein phosphatase [Leptospiraceae bacterium]
MRNILKLKPFPKNQISLRHKIALGFVSFNTVICLLLGFLLYQASSFIYSNKMQKNSLSNSTYSISLNSKNEDTIIEIKKKLANITAIVTFATFIIALFISLLLAKYFTEPLVMLSDGMNKLASGDLTALVEIKNKDEFGVLADNFNEMVTNLQISSEVQSELITEVSTLNENLERKVNERTKTIQAQSQELKKQLQMAEKIQLSLLPSKVPNIRATNISFKYKPMMQVGGDLLDFYHNNRELVLFICDVSGHGVPAAFLAAMVKMSLQSSYRMRQSPSQSIRKIHRTLQGKLNGHFVSAIFCWINLEDGTMLTSNAGHLPLIHIKQTGEILPIKSKGRVICEYFIPNSIEIKIPLEKGDKIVMYTDGIIEATNPSMELYGEDRLLYMLQLNYQESPQRLCDLIYNSAIEFMGKDTALSDDMTILIFEYTGEL